MSATTTLLLSLRSSGLALIALGLLALPADRVLAQPPGVRTLAEIERLLRDTPQDATLVQRSEAALAAEPPKDADRQVLADYWFERGFAVRQLGRFREARSDLERAVSFSERGSGRQVFALLLLGDIGTGLGDRAAMDAAHERILESVPKVSGVALYVQSTRLRDRASNGDLRRARLAAEAMSAIYRQLTSAAGASQYLPVWTSTYEAGRGTLAYYEGRHAEATDALKRALDEQRAHPGLFVQPTDANVVERGWQFGRDVLQSRLVNALREQNRTAEAEALGREALVGAVQFLGPRSTRAADALFALSLTWFAQGRYADARALAEHALERFRATSGRPSVHVLGVMARLGQYLVFEERWADADKVFAERARLIEANADLRKSAGPDTFYWALALVRLNQPARAVPMARRAVANQLRQYAAGDSRVGLSRSVLAIALARAGEPGALKEFREALSVLLDYERATESEEGVAFYRVQLLRWTLEEYLRLITEKPDGAAIDEAFRMSDVARASGVQRALAATAAREAFPDPELTRLAREEQDLALRIRALTELLAATQEHGGTSEPGVRLREEADAARRSRQALRAEIAQRYPAYQQLLDPKPLSLADARALLGDGEALVSIYAAQDATYVWAVRKGAEPVFSRIAMTAAQLAQRMKRLRRALDPGDADPRALPAYDIGTAHDLYQALLAPARAVIDGATSLVVVPHGPLGQINFALLVTAPGKAAAGGARFEGYRGIEWLVRRTAVSQVPSVAAFAALRGMAAGPGDRLAFAGFGDPVYGGSAAGPSATRGVRLRSARRDEDAGKSMALAQLAGLASLPDTRDEIEDIGRQLGAGSEMRFGLDANETAVKTAELSRRRVIAFATHGLLPGDLDGLAEPALALSNPQLTGERDADGLLTLGEIVTLKLNADWVILSACNTGAGEGEGSEAVSGLGRGFFFAGARALLVSNWPVETVSAREITTGIFRHQAQTPGLSRAEALRRAMLDVLDHGVAVVDGQPAFAYAHPLFWAPFSLVGDGR